ncbi:unnamed protein product [Lupinus luteus]|uniref:Uncharacterized protein n=1 Tax=Lupinus luteus TaxID=3873 RepID=A0AAV1X6Y7_LUPLU
MSFISSILQSLDIFLVVMLENDPTLKGIDADFGYQHYYKKYIQALQNAADKAHRKSERALMLLLANVHRRRFPKPDQQPKENDPTLKGIDADFGYQHYYKKYIQALQNAADKAHRKSERALMLLLANVHRRRFPKPDQQPKENDPTLKRIDADFGYQHYYKKYIQALQNAADKAHRKSERALMLLLANVHRRRFPKPDQQPKENDPTLKGIDADFGYQHYYKKYIQALQNAADKAHRKSERALMLLLANVHRRRFPKPDQQPKENDPTLKGIDADFGYQHYYKKYIQALQNAADKAHRKSERALMLLLANVHRRRFPKPDQQPKENDPTLKRIDADFGYQHYYKKYIQALQNAADKAHRKSERALMLLLANVHRRRFPKPDQQPKENDPTLKRIDADFGYQHYYKKYIQALQNAADKAHRKSERALMLLLANVHRRRFPKPDQQPKIMLLEEIVNT